jgi:hypothetical protein
LTLLCACTCARVFVCLPWCIYMCVCVCARACRCALPTASLTFEPLE